MTEVEYHVKNKKVLSELVEKRVSEFKNLEKGINIDNLIYNYKTEGRILEDFRNYQSQIELFKNCHVNVNPAEVLKI